MNTTLAPSPQILDTAAFTGHCKETIPWLWQDFLAAGMITLFTSRWKSGKTTLLSILLARKSSCSTYCGMLLAPFRATVVTEEAPELWAKRHQLLHFPDDLHWCSQPFLDKPAMNEWQSLITRLTAVPSDLVIIDTLSMVLPKGAENNPSSLLTALIPLRQLTRQGKAVLLVHHPKKGGPASELSPRGTGALTSFADILVDLDRLHYAPQNCRRRRMRIVSRLAASSTRVVELNAAETDYAVCADVFDQESFEDNWPVLLSIFVDDDDRLTRKQILKRWPADFDRPSETTLRRWLDQAEKEQKLERQGTGRRNHPFLYALPGHVDLMDPLPPFSPRKVEIGFMPNTENLSVQELAEKANSGGLDRRKSK